MTTAQTKPPRLPVPRSNACAQVVESGLFAHWSGGGTTVQVRCADCGRRLFDVATVYERYWSPRENTYWWRRTGELEIEKSCRECKSKVSGRVTADPGRPLPDHAGGLGGPWYCVCGASLAKVDPTRGRVTTTCRCGTVVRATAADAVGVASHPPDPAPAAPPAPPNPSLADMDMEAAAPWDDVPF